VEIDAPYRDVLFFGHELLDTVTIYRATQEDADVLENLTGMYRSKIIWGLAIGCNEDPHADIPLPDAEEYARGVRANGYGGVTIWSINRDTDHRSNSRPGECGPWQTGLPDSTFIAGISQNLF